MPDRVCKYIKRGEVVPHYKRVPGEKVYLSPISMDDIDIFMSWINDPEIVYNLAFYTKVTSLSQEKELVEALAKNGNTFSIVTQENDRIIGNCGFFGINEINRSAEIGIMIGEKDYHSKGYGTEAVRLLLKFGFENRNYNNIRLHVFSLNGRAIACYEKAGFKRQGICREALIRGDKKYDMLYMDILADEYFGRIISTEDISYENPFQ